MPMLTTSVMLFPLKPFHSPLRTFCNQVGEGHFTIFFFEKETEKGRTTEREKKKTYMTEGLHLVQHTVHLRHHVHAVHADGRVGAVPQSHVQHSATLGERGGEGARRENMHVCANLYVIL